MNKMIASEVRLRFFFCVNIFRSIIRYFDDAFILGLRYLRFVMRMTLVIHVHDFCLSCA